MPIQIPRATASLWMDYMFAAPGWQGFGLGGGVRYVGKTYGDELNTTSVSSFTLYDAAIHYERGPWRLALNVSNLFDRKYFSSYSGGTGTYYVSTERTVIGCVKYRF